MYPSAYYTYNPSRMKQAEKAYFKQGKPKTQNFLNKNVNKQLMMKILYNYNIEIVFFKL